MIRIDCYLAVLKKYREKYPGAIFILAMRKFNHVLSPSWDLINSYKESGDWKDYETHFKKQMLESRPAIEEMARIRELSKTNEIFIVCYEKTPEFCHRRLLKEMIESTKNG